MHTTLRLISLATRVVLVALPPVALEQKTTQQKISSLMFLPQSCRILLLNRNAILGPTKTLYSFSGLVCG